MHSIAPWCTLSHTPHLMEVFWVWSHSTLSGKRQALARALSSCVVSTIFRLQYLPVVQWKDTSKYLHSQSQVSLAYSSVAKLGHVGARALASRDCTPPVQTRLKIIGAKCIVVNRELGAKNASKVLHVSLS